MEKLMESVGKLFWMLSEPWKMIHGLQELEMVPLKKYFLKLTGINSVTGKHENYNDISAFT